MGARRVPTRGRRPAGRCAATASQYFCFLSAIDWMPSPYGRGEDDPTAAAARALHRGRRRAYAGGETRFQVFARVTDIERHVGVTVKVDVPDEPFALDSWHAIYLGANWHERETHEMFGIDFIGHPDLRNIYLPTEFEGYPLRKDFPLLARIVKPWPGIVDVEPMPAEEADEQPSAEPTDATEAVTASAPDRSADEPETGVGKRQRADAGRERSEPGHRPATSRTASEASQQNDRPAGRPGEARPTSPARRPTPASTSSSRPRG